MKPNPHPDPVGSEDELEAIFNSSPTDKEVPDDIWGNIHATWTGLWIDGYGEWDEKQPSDLFPLTDFLSVEREEQLKTALTKWRDKAVMEAEKVSYLAGALFAGQPEEDAAIILKAFDEYKAGCSGQEERK